MAENAERQGQRLRDALRDMKSDLITDIRGRGLLNGITIAEKEETSGMTTAWKLCLKMKENGLLAKPTHGDKIRFAPPLIITDDELDRCVEIIKKSIKEFE